MRWPDFLLRLPSLPLMIVGRGKGIVFFQRVGPSNAQRYFTHRDRGDDGDRGDREIAEKPMCWSCARRRQDADLPDRTHKTTPR